MRLTVWLLGREIITLSTDRDEAETDDSARDLSGGTLGSTEIGVGFVQTWLGDTGLD